MKQVLKKSLSVLLCVSLIFGCAPTAYADVEENQDVIILDSADQEYHTNVFGESLDNESETADQEAAEEIPQETAEETGEQAAVSSEEASENSGDEAEILGEEEVTAAPEETSEETSDQSSEKAENPNEGEALPLDEAAGVEYEAGEVIVVFNDEVDVESAVETLEEVDAVDEGSIDESSLLAEDIVVAEIDESITVSQAIEELNENPDVAYAQPNYIYHVLEEDTQDVTYDPLDQTAINDPLAASNQWSLSSTKLYDTWTLARADKEKVGVAVIDTGVMETHEDLKNVIPEGASFNATAGDAGTIGPAGDPHGHGTHVAGIAAAETDNSKGVSGVSYNAQIIPIRVLSDGGSMNTGYMARGYAYLLGNAGNGQTVAEKYNVKVINISLGSKGQDPTLFSWIDKAYNAGILTICSSGNVSVADNFNQFDLIYPAAYETCVSVGNLAKNGSDEFNCVIAGSSIANAQVDVSAPGSSIWSTYKTGAYTSMSGTSMASPYVAGIAALLFAVDSSATPDEVRSVLEDTAVDKGGTGWDIYYGHGVVNPYDAVKEISDTTISYSGTRKINEAIQCSVTTNLTEPTASDWKWSVEGDSASFASITNAGVLTATKAGAVDVKATYIKDESVFATAEIMVGIEITLEKAEYVYTGSPIKPGVRVTLNGVDLASSEYSVSYANNTSVGSALISVKGSGGLWSGSATKYFKIIPAQISNATISLSASSYTYSGKKNTPVPTLIHKGKTLKVATDYTVSYSNNVNAGTSALVTIKGKGNFTGTTKKNFRINPRPISSTMISVADQSYTGKPLSPTVMVKYGGALLKKSSDYSVSYSNNTQIGNNAKVTIRGKGNYTGSVTKSFKIKGISLSFTAHVQNKGWLPEVSNGKYGGAPGQGLRTEAIKVNLVNNTGYSGSIQYATHVQNIGWQSAASVKTSGSSASKTYGGLAGTSGRSLRVEAYYMKLTGELSKQYDIYYRVYAQDIGWLGWAKNGQMAGTAGNSLRLEAMQVYLAKKGSAVPGTTFNGASAAYSGVPRYINSSSISGDVSYGATVHIQNIGDKSYASTKGTSYLGTSGRSLRLESMKLSLKNQPSSGGITYRTHVQNIGWQGWKSNGVLSGTTGRSLRLEAVSIKLTGNMAKGYDVYYRTHIQNIGWTGWAKNGQNCGSAGYAYRMEAMQIVVVKKGAVAPGLNKAYFYQK